MGVDRALRLSGRARGVHDQCIVPGTRRIQRDVCRARTTGELAGSAHHRPGSVARQPSPALCPIDHAYRRIHVSRHVAQLAPAGGRVHGDDDGAETQRAEEDDDRVHRRRATPEHPVPRHDAASGQGCRGQRGPAAPIPGHAARRPNCAPPGEPDDPVRHATVATTPRAVCGRWSDQPAARAAHLVVCAGTMRAPCPSPHPHPVSEPPHAIVWRT